MSPEPALDYGLFSFASKAEMLEKSREYWNPDKTSFWSESGVPLVIDRREEYFIYDVSGTRLIDLHLNGGTYNLGHRNPEVVQAITVAMQHFDIGNHHFPSLARTALAEALVSSAPAGLTKVIYASGGGEAIDIALKTARHTTQKRKIVSIVKAYHGHTGLAVATGDDRFSKLFLSDQPDDFPHVPFNDLVAMEDALRARDVAAVIMETIPATFGFPLPEPGYLEAVKVLCERYDALYIADEVQTGLMRTGEMWGITKHHIEPDIMVTGKGIGGGMYPIAAVLVSERCAGWLREDGFGHISTFGGAELGCIAALKVLEVTGRPETRSMVHYIADFIGRGLREIAATYPDWFIGIRQNGVIFGLEFAHPQGAKFVMKRLYENGVWAIFSTLDPRVLQFKPGILLKPEVAEELLDRVEVAIAKARQDVLSEGRGRPAMSSDTLFELPLEPAGVPRGRSMIERAEWAARAFASYDAVTVQRIVDAAASAGAARAEELAEWAVRETGFGVVAHKVVKNLACSTGVAAAYRAADFVDPVVDTASKIVSVPRPAGVVLALTPSTNPVATVYFKILLALMTRNAIVISPHPFAKGVGAEAARTMAAAAVAAGAPDGCIQVVEEPSIPLVNAMMTDTRTDVIVATGGSPMVRAAYRSGNPAIGVGPGNVPVLVDASADLAHAARMIVDSKSFDNSILCTNESVLVVVESVADRLLEQMTRAGAHLLADADRDKVRSLVFPDGHLDTRWIGKDATVIAKAAGVRVPPRTTVLLAPVDLVVPEEPLAHEKLLPVLGVVRVATASRGIDAARAVLRITGEGHSAAIHSTDARTIMDFSAAVRVLRVSVNVGNSLGSSGLATNLAPSMTIGTGFFGRSAVGENLEPKHLVNWTRVAYNSDAAVPMADFAGLSPWRVPAGAVPAYPRASNDDEPMPSRPDLVEAAGDVGELREEIRRLIIEELNAIVKG